MNPDRLVLFCNLSRPPSFNTLLPAVRAFQKAFRTTTVEPCRQTGYVPTRGAKPALVPDSAVMANTDPPPGLVVCLGGSLHFTPWGLRHLRSRPETVLAHFALSDPYDLPASMLIARQFDLFYTQDWQTITDYAALDIPVRRCDLATDPELYKPARTEPDCDILYYGKWTMYRHDMLRTLASRFRVRIHSYAGETRWSMRTCPPLYTPQALGDAINRARLVFDPSRLDDAEGKYRDSSHLSSRSFFAASCGVPALVEDFPGLAKYFDPATEIAAFGANEGLLALAGRILGDEPARVAMGRRARQRVLREHTWDSRVESFLLDVRRWRTQPRTAAAR